MVTEVTDSLVMCTKRKGGWKKYHSLKGIEYFPCLKKLEMNNINIGNPNISKNKLLQSVRLYNTFTTYINVNENVRLKRLYISSEVSMVGKRSLKNIDVSHNKQLEELTIKNYLPNCTVIFITHRFTMYKDSKLFQKVLYL